MSNVNEKTETTATISNQVIYKENACQKKPFYIRIIKWIISIISAIIFFILSVLILLGESLLEALADSDLDGDVFLFMLFLLGILLVLCLISFLLFGIGKYFRNAKEFGLKNTLLGIDQKKDEEDEYIFDKKTLERIEHFKTLKIDYSKKRINEKNLVFEQGIVYTVKRANWGSEFLTVLPYGNRLDTKKEYDIIIITDNIDNFLRAQLLLRDGEEVPYKKGDTITIGYDPKNPTVCKISATETDNNMDNNSTINKTEKPL